VGQSDTPPPLVEMERATITYASQKLVLTGSCKCELPQPGHDPCYQAQISELVTPLQLQLTLTGSQRQLMGALSGSLGFAVSNGSYKDEAGVAAWIIKGPDSTNRIVGSWHTPGYKEDHSSFRSELAGIIGVLHTISFWTPPHETMFCLACDGLSVVTQLLSAKPMNMTEPHADLLCAAQVLLHSCGYKVDLVFVCGHQDSGLPTVLAHNAWLNIEADALAKVTVSIPFTGPTCYKLPGNAWACYVDNCRIIKQFDSSLRNFINGQELKKYWEKRKVLHPDILSWVDWFAIGRTMKESSIDRQWWVSKQMSRHFAHGKIWSAGNKGRQQNALDAIQPKKIRLTSLLVNRMRQI